MLTIDVSLAGQRVFRRMFDAWSEKDHPRKAGKFVKKGEGVGAANELSEKHGVTGGHVIEGEDHAGHGMTVRDYVKKHGAKSAQQLLSDHASDKLTFKAPGSASPQHYEVYDPRAKSVVTAGSLADIKKKGVYVYSKHAVAADILGSARLGGGATNNKGEHKGKTYVLRVGSKPGVEPAVEPAGALEAPLPPTPKPSTAAALAGSTAGSIDASDWKSVGPQLGSNPGGTYEAPNGTKYYVKQLKSQAHVESETLANALYEKLGVHTSKPQHVTMNGKAVIASKMQKLEKFEAASADHVAQARKHFAAHAFLANHDATGLSQDNHAFVGGQYATIDAGGSLKYRAQGALKSSFGHDVDELDTMRDASKNAASHVVFGSMTSAEIAESAEAVVKLSNADIKSLVGKHMKSASPAERSEMTETLIKRRDDVKKRVDAMQKNPKSEVEKKKSVVGVMDPAAEFHVKNEKGSVVASGTHSVLWGIHGINFGKSHKMKADALGQASLDETTHVGNYAGKKLTLHAGAAESAPKFHVKTPLTEKVVAQGTIAELNAAGISTNEKQVKAALEIGSYYLDSTLHSGEHKGKKYLLHKGEAPDLAKITAKIAAKSASEQEQYHIKKDGKHVTSGTLEELKSEGVHVTPNNLLDLTEYGESKLYSHKHGGKHAGQHYFLHKGASSPSKYELTPASEGYAASDDFKRPEKDRINNADYLSMSKKQHDEIFSSTGGDKIDNTAQTVALQDYTGSEYLSMNDSLRSGNPNYTSNKIHHLQNLIKRSKLQDDHVLWRGVSSQAMHHVTNLQPGDHFKDPAFLSSSHSKQVAKNFAGYNGVLMAIRARKGASGIHVGSIGHHLTEHEVVLPHSSKLRYAGRSSEGHYVFDHVD